MKSPKNLAILLLVLTTIGGATVAWRQYQELIELRAAALSKDERADLQQKLWNAEKRIKELTDELAAHRGTNNEDGTVAAADNENPTSDGAARRGRRGGPGGPGGFNNLMTMMERPEVQKLMAIEQKGQLDTRYAALFKSLNLSPEQLDKFKALLVERQTAMQDAIAAARAQGIDPLADRDGLRKMVADSQTEVDNNIKATLGDDGFDKYQNYQQTLPQRNVVSQLQQSLSYTGSPLSDTQAEQLVQILAQTAPKTGANRGGAAANEMNVTVGAPPDGGGGGRGGAIFNVGGAIAGFGGGGGATITDQAIALAQGVLSAPQVQSLQQLQQQQQAQQQLQQTLRQSFGGGGGRNGAGGTNGGASAANPAATPAPAAGK